MLFATYALMTLIIVATLAVWIYFNKSINLTKKELIDFNAQLQTTRNINNLGVPNDYPIIKHLIARTVKNKISIKENDEVNSYSLQEFLTIWNRKNIFHHINIALYDAVPNIIIGVGLTFTFIFLALALNNVNSILASGDSSAVMKLLSYTGSKFSTSLAGLTCSILWVIASKIQFQKIDQIIHGINIKLSSLAPTFAAEKSIILQNEKLMQMVENSQKIAETSQLTLKWLKNDFIESFENNFSTLNNNYRYQLSNLTHTLAQLHSQTTEHVQIVLQPLAASLKHLEQDLSNEIGASVANALQPVLTRHKDALQTLANKSYTIQETALKEMVGMFLKEFTHVSHDEMHMYLQSIRELGLALNESTEKFGANTNRASEYFAATVSKSAQSFESSIINTAAMMDKHAQENISEIVLSYGSHLEEASMSFHHTQSKVTDTLNANINASIANIEKLKYSVENSQQLNAELNSALDTQLQRHHEASQQQAALNSASKDISSKLQESLPHPIKIDKKINEIHTLLTQQQRSIEATSASIGALGCQINSIDTKITTLETLPTRLTQNPIQIIDAGHALNGVVSSDHGTRLVTTMPDVPKTAENVFIQDVTQRINHLFKTIENDPWKFKQAFDESTFAIKIWNLLYLGNNMTASPSGTFDVVTLFLKTPLKSGANVLVYVREGTSGHHALSKIFENMHLGTIVDESSQPALLRQDSGTRIILSNDKIIKKGVVTLKS